MHRIRARWFDAQADRWSGARPPWQGLPNIASTRAKLPEGRRRHYGVVLSAALSFYKRCVRPSQPLVLTIHHSPVHELYTLQLLFRTDDAAATVLALHKKPDSTS